MENEAVAYKDTVVKLLEHQKNILANLDELKDKGQLPEGLDVVMGPVQEWGKGLAESQLSDAPSQQVAEAFSAALQAVKSQLDDHMQREANEYNALLGDLRKITQLA